MHTCRLKTRRELLSILYLRCDDVAMAVGVEPRVLSILYLRCGDVFLKQRFTQERTSFNSLFEMRISDDPPEPDEGGDFQFSI